MRMESWVFPVLIFGAVADSLSEFWKGKEKSCCGGMLLLRVCGICGLRGMHFFLENFLTSDFLLDRST